MKMFHAKSEYGIVFDSNPAVIGVHLMYRVLFEEYSNREDFYNALDNKQKIVSLVRAAYEGSATLPVVLHATSNFFLGENNLKIRKYFDDSSSFIGGDLQYEFTRNLINHLIILRNLTRIILLNFTKAISYLK